MKMAVKARVFICLGWLGMLTLCLGAPKHALAAKKTLSFETNAVAEHVSSPRQSSPLMSLAKKEDRKRSGNKKKERKTREEGHTLSGEGPCIACQGLDGFVPPAEISDDVRRMVGKYRGGGGMENVKIQRQRGVIETGLYPLFAGQARCPEIDSEQWAIDYSHKRGKAALHKGIDIPQPRGTPVRAVADGVVIGRFRNSGNRKGIEVMLRHTPAQTGLPFWTYSQYTHLAAMSPLPIGHAVRKGEEIGKTSNTGKMGRRIRRDALHFAVMYSELPQWSNDGGVVIPKKSYFMDPVAFYRLQGPYDSQSLRKLPDERKATAVPYMQANGAFVPPHTNRIWPYVCP